MPLTKFEIAPGIIKDESPLASEGGWIDADKIRFVAGRPQVIGGWQKATSDVFEGIERGHHDWVTAARYRALAWGTAEKLYVLLGGTIRDITPPASEGVLVNPFTTAAGSNVVTVTHTDHGLITSQTVTFSNQSAAVGGLIFGGDYIATVTSKDIYQITAADTASATETGGGAVDYLYTLYPGRVNGTGEVGGYGTRGYGEGGYGGTSGGDTSTLIRVWFLDNWGDTLVALPRGGALYQYQPSMSYPERLSNGGFDSATGITLGTGWSIGGGVASAVAGASSDMSMPPLSVIPGYVYRIEATITRTAGEVQIRSDAGTLGYASTPISVSGTYSRRFRAIPGMSTIVFGKDAAFAGTIDNVSVKLEDRAYRIDEAPVRSNAMFVDAHQIVVLLGTSSYMGSYDPLIVRWCHIQNIQDWVPTVANIAGDDILAIGTRLIAGRVTRQQNLIWSDSALYTMQYTGDSAAPFVFSLSGTGCGLIGPMAHAEHDGTVFWVGNNRFYIHNGGAPTPIPCRIERDLFDHISENQGEKISCGIITRYLEVWIFYPDNRDGNECSRYVIYRLDENHFSVGTFSRTGLVRPEVFEFPIMFSTDGRVYFHEIGNSADGGVIDAFIESSYFDIGDGDNLIMVRRIIGDFEDLSGYVGFTLSGRMWPTSTERSYGPYVHTPQTRKLDMRVTARQMKVKLSSIAMPLFWRLGALRFDVLQLGEKQ